MIPVRSQWGRYNLPRPFIVDFPMEHGGSFHSFLYVYQRVYFASLRTIDVSVSFRPRHISTWILRIQLLQLAAKIWQSWSHITRYRLVGTTHDKLYIYICMYVYICIYIYFIYIYIYICIYTLSVRTLHLRLHISFTLTKTLHKKNTYNYYRIY